MVVVTQHGQTVVSPFYKRDSFLLGHERASVPLSTPRAAAAAVTTAGTDLGERAPRGLMAGMSQRPPTMYWCVGPEGSAVCPGSAMETHNGARDMGSKLSTPGSDPTAQCPGTEDIHTAYKRGDTSRARHLLREACDESTSQLEKGQLLSISAAYGDLETVRYLLTKRQVRLSTEPTDDNPAVVAALFGHTDVVQELLESLPGSCSPQRLLNWMLALACQRGHLGLVKLLVLTHGADPESYAVRKNEFPVIVRLPLYAAIKSGNEDVAIFLLRHGAFFCSYILLDSPDSSKRLLRKYFIEASALPGSYSGKMALSVKWSHLRLPWVDLDWLIDISCQITELDLSANCLSSLPSVIPWGLINLRKLDVSDNHLGELPSVQSSDEIICSRLLEIDVSSNKLSHLPPGFLHLSKLQKLTASKNYLEKLFEEESTTANWIGLRKLQELDLSDNKLTELPAVFLHSFKSLSCLNVSRNNLKVFPDAWACPLKCCKAPKNALESLPDKMAVFWKNHLKDVDFSENALREVPLGLFQLDALTFLRLQGNQLVTLPPPEKWTCKQLKTLDLSRNQFGKNEDGLKTKRISFFTTRGRPRSGTETGVCWAGRCGCCRVLAPCSTGRAPQLVHGDATIKTTKWELQRPAGSKAKVESVEFNVWDIGGPASMATVNQCFFTDKALYVVVWNLALGEEAVANLQFWLLSIEVRAWPISFLIETGALLHFPDTSHGLRNLYFLDPIWLSECLQRIFTIRGSRSVAKNGVIRAEDLRVLLVGTGFTQQTEEQYFQFLAKFEIALPVANNRCVTTRAAPRSREHGAGAEGTRTCLPMTQPSFPMRGGIRFGGGVSKAGGGVAEMGSCVTGESLLILQLFETRKNTRSRHRKVAIYSFAGNQRNRCSTFRVRRNQTIYWQEGLLVTFDGGYLSVESSDVNWKKKKSGGIKIICQSEVRDFSAMAFITDHVNSLIDQWFPALTATESDGTPLMEQYVPCPVCEASWAQHADAGDRAEGVQYFDMEDCVLTAIECDFISCPRHPDLPVPLQELVPELFMTDFPARLFLENSKLEHSEDQGSILGQGGSGTVIYRARYQGQPVAVKRFQIKKFKNFANAPADTMLRHLRATDAMKNFSEFRQEASMLHALQHPCIVSLIGISIHPLCFALELAPLGSLNTVLSENAKDSSFMPLGHMLTQKIAYQIASGLAYLHKKSIIFCDLKSDNILVWSLDPKEHVNIKLSDYGISRQSFHEGALGVEGTPGYQAPEIRPRIVYDEKVDMFSYGMVLYELLSGQRPALGHHQLQIAKKLSKGVRPVLGPPEEVQFHRLQALMVECWDTQPEKRPLALSVVSQMQDPTFATFMYLLPCGKQTAFFSPQGQDYTVVFWDGKEGSRNYTVANTEKGLLEVQRMSCAGMKLSCQLKVHSCLWTATEDQKIYIYSLKGMCPLNTPQRALDTPAVVTCFLAVPVLKKNSYLVLAGLADGLVAVFSVVRGAPDDSCSYLCSHTANRSKFGIADDDVRQNPYPVKAMEVVNSGSEVWCSNGPGLLVVDCAALEIRRRLEPFCAPSLVTSIVCSSECRGEEVVWCLDDRANSLVMYHSATYQLCARYFCGDPNPLRDVFPVGPAGPEPLDVLESRCPQAGPPDHRGEAAAEHVGGWGQAETHRCPPSAGSVPLGSRRPRVPAPARWGAPVGYLRHPPSLCRVLMDAAVVAKDTVVCGFENENMEWCLAVWRGWGTREFDVFYQSYEELGRLEACTRKKR
ncbi:leucine-rich repeat serine/threonine-protein kinase 1 [Pteropus vampyrus]|uniref:Leucine-rich repeat serine/threonine-protein kinase 1 n=1 Tax=Pteropus vampyrus TaxID=132908 RepID=A0A6P6CBU0_PTEVA|nr:leucine-rich repeat serine/threonine-protein kinase 1 [Pteropus vampyrus]